MARKISTETADMLRRQVLDGTLAPGSRLPSERELSERLGMSRVAVRDALKTLHTEGLLEVFLGRGWFVAQDASEDRSAAVAMTWVYSHRHELKELNEVRQLLEPRAVQTMPRDRVVQVASLASKIVAKQAEAVRLKDYKTAAELDADFHSTLISETPNTPLRVLTEQLITMAKTHALGVYEVPGAAAHSLEQHEGIVAALEADDAPLAARLIRQHAKTASRFALAKLHHPTKATKSSE